MIYLRYNTASQEFPLGRFVDTSDANTEKTALTIANTDIKLWKTGATTLVSKNSGGATHIANGEYYCVMDATDTDTLGSMKVCVHVSGALSLQVMACVLPAKIYDALIAGSDNLEVDLIQALGTAITASGGRPEVNTTLIEGVDATDQLDAHNGGGGGGGAIVLPAEYM